MGHWSLGRRFDVGECQAELDRLRNLSDETIDKLYEAIEEDPPILKRQRRDK